jgi:streptomycin 3"-adenylyltransferase
MSVAHKQRLVSRLLKISRKPRRLELTIVVQSDIRPWRYPPRMDFQYGDWWREEFERGELDPGKKSTLTSRPS